MKNYPVFNLPAVPHKDAASGNRIFSTAEIDYFLFVRVPQDFGRHYELYQVDEVADTIEKLCCKGLWEHDRGRPWYRFKSENLNMDPGYHMYRLSFVNYSTNDTSQLYISYIIQSNNPEKPYMYMDKENRKCNCNADSTSGS